MTHTGFDKLVIGGASVEPSATGSESRTAGRATRGRPTDYDPIACELVLKLGANGASITEMAYELGVARSSIYRWMSFHDEFSDAVTRARELAQVYWERVGRVGVLSGREFNGANYQFMMRNRFPDKYRI